jgi:cyclase
MLMRRLIPCLDVVRGRVTKGVRFRDNVELGDPVEIARRYYEDGCDELVVYDITASAEHRATDLAMVARVARAVHVPFAVGGGISGVPDMARVLDAGAEKVSVNSLAVQRPEIIREGARAFGSQCVVLGLDAARTDNRVACPSGYEVTIRGFRERTGRDAVEWARQAAELGAGEVVVNAVDADGTREGYELTITRLIAEAVPIPVVASGGAGRAEHLRDAFITAKADAAIVAGILHTGRTTLARLKAELAALGVPVRS